MPNPDATSSFPPPLHGGEPDGFSLIDLIIAAAVGLFLILAAGQLVLHSFIYTRRSRMLEMSTVLASNTIERLKSLDPGSAELEGEHEISETAPGTSIGFLIRWSAEFSPPYLKSIRIECRPGPDPARGTRILVYRSEILGF